MTDLYKLLNEKVDAKAVGGDSVPNRADVKLEETWDVEAIFADVEAFEAAFASLKERLPKYSQYVGKLKDAEVLNDFLTKSRDDLIDMGKLYVYAHLKNDEDTADTKNMGLFMRARQLYSEFGSALAFYRPEIAAWEEDEVKRLLESADLSEWEKFLDEITRFAPHTLTDNEEKMCIRDRMCTVHRDAAVAV